MKVCFLGGTRYSKPLDATQEKKWRRLAELGEMYVIAFSTDLHPRHFTQHAHFYLLPQWPLPVLRYITMFTVAPWLALWLILRKKVKVLVAQSPYEGFAATIAKIISKIFGQKVALVVENHGDFEKSLFLQRKVIVPQLYRAIMRYTAKIALKNADVFRAISNPTRDQLKRWAPGKPIIKFPAWTDMGVFLKEGQSPKGQSDDVLFAGVITPLKGVHYLINAFARIASQFPKARLWIVGREENPEYAQSVKARALDLGLDGRIVFVDEVSQAELAKMMHQARVFVLPSLSEGLGRVVFEAMATGTPVIASRVGGIPQMVKDGVNGFLVPPGDEAALAERLQWVLTHPEEIKRMGKQAQEFVRGFFSPESYVKHYQALFQMALEQLDGK